MKTFKLAKTAVAALALCAGSAQAVPVTQWTVLDTATFLESSILPGAGNGIGGNPVLSNGDQTLTWGNNGISGLVINNTGNPFTVDTGVLKQTISVTHYNQPINEPSLDFVTIIGNLSLTSKLPAPPGLPVVAQLPFSVNFYETPNAGTEIPGPNLCADGGLVGQGVNINGCGDIFVIGFDSLNFPFVYEGLTYYFSFFAENGFGPLGKTACNAAGAADNCRGFKTPENANTTAYFDVLITSTPFQVPEPGSLALMGLGLGSLGWIARRRKQQQG